MLLEEMIDAWKEVREKLIAEVSQIPEEHFAFQATPETRSVADIVRHILEAQAFLVGEVCRPDTNFRRAPIMELIKSYSGDVRATEGKDELIKMLGSSMESAETAIRSFGEDALKETMERLDGKTMSKLSFLQFVIRHESYHQGQITVYERLMQIEPALTTQLKQFLAANK